MKAAIFYGAKKIKIEEVKKPTPGPKDAIIKVDYCGICGSDRYKYYSSWTFPLLPETKPDKPERLKYIPGHEVTGTIVELGKGINDFQEGEVVAVYCIAYCGKCYYCKQGLTNRCTTYDERILGDYWDGGFAEYMKVPERCLLKIPQGVSAKEANLTLDTIGVPYHCLSKIENLKTSSFAIYGCGPIGLSTIKMLRMMGVENLVIGIDIVERKLNMAKEMGASEVINAELDDPVKVVKELTGGVGVDITIDASGREEAQKNALNTSKKGGMVIIWGESPSLKVDASLQLIHNELTIRGTVYFLKSEHPKIIEFLQKSKNDFVKLISDVYPLEKIEEAFQLFFEEKNSLRVLIQP